MSGQPPRAAGPVQPAPRLLLYVAEPRRPEPAPPALQLHHTTLDQQLPRNNSYRTQADSNDQHNSPSAVFYKSMSEQDNGFVSYATNNSVTHIPEFYQQFVKEQCLKVDKVDDQACNVGVKRDCASTLSGDFNCIETLGGRIPVEQGELVTYQTRCPTQVCADNTMPPMQPLVIRNQNQFESVQRVSSDTNCADRDISVDKCYVNYQLLEQSVSHQSIVNQSISILNQQVGVSQRIVSEGESGSPQLVRTVDGVVLAVLPGGSLPVPDTENKPAVTEPPLNIVVPLGWKRIVHGTSVIYLSPSGNAISTIPQLREYLQTAGTCKCGLPCPLRPETAFSFDPKVMSKPYQPASGAELTKLCNHKRKLLATLQARAQSPATPPLQQIDSKKVVNTEVGVLKKKMKKRPAVPQNMSVSQMMVQRDRPVSEFKIQDNELRTVSPGVNHRVSNVQQQQTMSNFTPLQQNISMLPDEIKQDNVQRSSHYLTVNSGWITQQKQENIDTGQKQTQISQSSGNPTLNVGLPVLGTNGQIIGVNTGYNKHANYKSLVGVMSQNLIEDVKDERKDLSNTNQSVKKITKEEDAQIFCGLNQALTPEVMQKINEQQQLFIQQNQKQIEMARKGYKPQLSDTQSKQANPNQYVPQAQLVIQNGTVVKTNPAKTPPWQVKKSDSNTVNPLPSPSPKPHRLEISDFEESNASYSEESSGSSSSFQNNEQLMNQMMCSRVPPLPQDYHMMGQQWPAIDMGKKKSKINNKVVKKKNSPTENKIMSFGNNGVRILQDNKIIPFENIPSPANNVPSFMEDPNGFLAQQTVLLNNTISRQVGINPNFESNQYESSNLNSHNHIDHTPCKQEMKITETSTYRQNTVPNHSPSPNNTPDSSIVGAESGCCQPCPSGDLLDHMRYRYIKQNNFKMDYDTGTYPSLGSRSKLDESSVTSTFPERSPPGNPIQGGTVSTSRVSPEALSPPPAASPAPTPPNAHIVHFISNHNVNKNLMDVDHISLVGVRGSAPTYWPPPHLGGGPARSARGLSHARVSTMASGLSVTRDTVTSVLAGRAGTATTSTAAAARPPPRPDPASACAIPPHRPDPFLDSVALPTSYPLHIAGTTAQNMISRSPFEMLSRASIEDMPPQGRRSCPPTTPGQILISSMGQIIVSSSHMPPPPPKTSSVAASSSGAQPGGMVVNPMPPGQFVLQPPMVTVDGQTMQQSSTLPHSMPGLDGSRVGDPKVSGLTMLSPESLKRKSRKKKCQTANISSVVQISPPGGNMVVQTGGGGAQFSPRGFSVSPPGSAAPVLQALTIVPGKSSASAHLLVSNQSASAFPAPASQQINLLQPVNLINNSSGVVNNFPAFQQFIVPNLGSMMMTPDGTAIIQDGSSGMPMQLQLQTVNGQNVLTPVQNSNMYATGANGGVVIRPPTNQGKIIQSQHSPGAQFLTPSAQVMMGSPNFNGQLSPLLANLSPTNVTFNTSPHRVRSTNIQAQEFIQTNQVGQTLMVPISPKQASIAAAPTNQRSSTYVQQNTTIVQQQTTLVSNSHSAQLSSISTNIQGANPPRLSVGSSAGIARKLSNQRRLTERAENAERSQFGCAADSEGKPEGGEEAGVRHSVSTQTRGKSPGSSPPGSSPPGSSPPDTTTHSPLGPLEPAPSPRLYRLAAQPDTTTKSPEPADSNSSAMVQCVSSSEQDMLEAQSRLDLLPPHRRTSTHQLGNERDHNMMPSLQLMRQNRSHNPMESSDLLYNQNMNTSVHNQQNMMSAHYYERTQTYKRKNDFGDLTPYRTEKMMRTNYNMVHGLPKEDFDMGMSQEQTQRHFSQSGSSTDTQVLQKVYERHNIGSGNDGSKSSGSVAGARRGFQEGDLVWGPVRGYRSWPGVVCDRQGPARFLVRWFGARPPSAVPEEALLTLSEGLEAHHAASTHQRKSRKLNTLLENAIQEAMAELDKKSEIKRTGEEVTQESNELSQSPPIEEIPKRNRKLDKVRSKSKNQKKSSIKTSSNCQRSGDGGRLRSSR